MINNLYLKVSPRELLEGECTATKNGLELKHGRELVYNRYSVDIEYECVVRSRDKELRNLEVMKFVADVRLIINA